MSRPDKLTDLSSPKRRRTTRSGAAKVHSMLSSISQSSSKSMNPEPSATTTLCDHPVITNSYLKHVEEKLASFNTETPNTKIALSSTSSESLIIELSTHCKKVKLQPLYIWLLSFKKNFLGLDLGFLRCQD